MAAFDWSHTTVTAGSNVTVRVNSAPCHPVTVTLLIDGVPADQTTVEPPGSAELAVPAGSQGAGYTLKLTCNGQQDSRGGVVA
jgi:hypothetical protein